jgi:DNA invertase Pin-like site-specific DNA recombinase
MAAGCAKVFAEKISGARTDRAELTKVMRRIEVGDLLIVTRLDRLARSTRDLLNILHQLAEKGAKFRSLHDPWCDTSTPQGELLVTILAGFATFERHLIKARTDDGRKRAQARGVRFGRPRKLDAHQRQEAIGRLARGETLVDVARTFGVDPTTIGRIKSSSINPLCHVSGMTADAARMLQRAGSAAKQTSE